MQGRTVEIRFLGSTRELEAALARAGLVAEESGKKIGDSFNKGTDKAAGGLHKLSALGASWGVPFMGSLDQVGRKLDEAHTKTGKFTTALAEAGKVSLQAGAVGFAAVGYESVKMAESFQTATASIAANAGITQKAANSIGQAFLNTGGQSAYTGTQMAQAFAAVAGQLKLTEGHALDAASALRVMTAATDLAEATGQSLATTTSAIAQTMQAYHLSVGQAASASDVLFNVSKSLAVPVSTVSTALARLHSRLGELAPSLSDTSTLMVELGGKGIIGSRGIMVVNTALQTLVGHSKNSAAVLKDMGVSLFDANGHFIGLRSAIAELQPQFAKMTQAQQIMAAQMLFGKGAAQTMLQVIQGGVAQFDRASAAANKMGTAHRAASIQAKTLHEQIKTLEATVTDLGTKFGMFLIPKLEDVAKWLANGINWMEKHKAAAEALGAVIAGVLGAAVAAFAYTKAVAFVGAVQNMLGGIGRLAQGVGAAATSMAVKFGLISSSATTATTEAGTQMTLFATETETASAAAEGAVTGAAAGIDTALGSTGIGLIIVGAGIAITELATHWSQAMNAVQSATQTVLNDVVIPILNTMISLINNVISGMNSLIGVFNSTIGQLTGSIGTIGSLGNIGNVNLTGGGTAPGPDTRVGAHGHAFHGFTGPSNGRGNAPSGVNPQSFAYGLLQQLGAPVTKANVASIMAWEGQEGTKAAYNPLAITVGAGAVGALAGNTSSVLNLKSMQYGVTDTANFLRKYGYSKIIAALMSGRGLFNDPALAAELLAWSGHGYSSITPGAGGSLYAYTGTHGGGGGGGGSAPVPTSGPGVSGPLAGLLAGGGTAAAHHRIRAAATSTIPVAVATMLSTAQALLGTHYTWGGGHAGWDPVAVLKKIGVDCSGFVSAVLHAGGVRMPGPLTTSGLPGVLSPGAGKYVTVYDRPTGSQAHTLIDILGKWFMAGGNPSVNPGSRVAELTAHQAAQELAGGGFQQFHPNVGGPMATRKQLAALGISGVSGGAGVSSTTSVTAAVQSIVQAIVSAATGMLTRYGNLQQGGSVLTLERGLGVRTNTPVPWGAVAAPMGPGGLNRGDQTIAASLALHNIFENTGLTSGQQRSQATGILSAASSSSPQGQAFMRMVEELRAAGKDALAHKLIEAHKAALQTLAIELQALQKQKDAESIKLEATQIKDMTALQANTAADQLNILKAQAQQQSDALTAQTTIMRDMATVSKDIFAGMAQAVQDQTTLMADAANSVVQGINDQTQIRVDIMGERGLYGLNLIAQQEIVQYDILKASYDAQIATAQQTLDQLKAQWNAIIAGDQTALDQVQLQQDQLVAAAQQNADTVAVQSAIQIAQAQATVDSTALRQDIGVQLAQTAVDLSAGGSKAQQDAAAAQLQMAEANQSLYNSLALQNLEAVAAAANNANQTAQQALQTVQDNAAAAIAAAQTALETAQGQSAIAIAQAEQSLQQLQDTAAIAEAFAQGQIAITQEQAATQFAGSGLVVNMYGIPVTNATAVAGALDWFARTSLQVPA